MDGHLTLEWLISALLSLLAFIGSSLWWGQRDLVKELRACTTALALLAQRLDGHIEAQAEWRHAIEKRLERLEHAER